MGLTHADAILERMRADTESDWADRLLRDLEAVPLVAVHAVQMEQRAPAMSATQLQVLRCAAHGLDYQLTADALGLSFFTVQDHLKAARYRLGAKNTTHACCLAIRLGLIA